MKPAQTSAHNTPPQAKTNTLHPNNPHHGRYDLAALVKTLPELKGFIIQTPKGEASIAFANAKAVVCLNKALLKHFYGIDQWTLPQGFLCPPIPGRADYIHHIADLLQQRPVNRQALPIKALDIGTGANLIYPIIAHRALNWEMVGSEVSPSALKHAQKLIDAHPLLQNIQLRQQKRPEHIFNSIIQTGEYFDITLCNPPFFRSQDEANAQAARKWRNLKGAKSSSVRNFGGQQQELWCEGGELAFLRSMIDESVHYAKQVGWFTSIVSNLNHVPPLKKELKKRKVPHIQVLEMSQGQKHTHILAWSFQA
ncbi:MULTISPECIES: 23S rRNA (adenine(1618)-N(6))-methyltransferase RlmF [Vitreoscilla]|uniref:Ribosomal RNA large subunit methyltransferase F n=1 Tax=Vitreoscilla stercoraria TaxID=61 RepID=A0ABY4EAY3_VITST|nr:MULTISPECIES: 23S rRNA (adenine(1618)-N(6))-methyltransferase RlmF [Vitreoscilla]AUZ06015.2 ribosomal RNA large subunit methyltransferase F [Vitreoscilla sp. C1]UOO92612.1 23S rRNA (adenine(1618)-N(6))-methyltransferase RlmF [Vitreoscilla stercoraria]